MAKQEILDWMAAEGVSLTAVFIPFSQSRNKDKKHPSLNWRVTVRKTAAVRADEAGRPGSVTFEILATDYGAGSAHCPAYKIPIGQYGRAGKERMIAWECENGRKAVTLYGDHISPNTKSPRLEPDAADVLASLALDSGVLDAGGFEDWASNYGYETDSRKAEAIYRACLDIALKLRNGLGNDALERLRVACQDY